MQQLPLNTNSTFTQCKHDGKEPIKIGKYSLWLGAGRSITDVTHVDTVVTLNGDLPHVPIGSRFEINYVELRDYGGVPDGWADYIKMVAEEIRSGRRYLGFCTGGHGRTGCFAASLVAELNKSIIDPIAYVRKHHCHKAVESQAQAEAVFAITGKPLPEKYKKVVKTYQQYGKTTTYKPLPPPTIPHFDFDDWDSWDASTNYAEPKKKERVINFRDEVAFNEALDKALAENNWAEYDRLTKEYFNT